MGHKKLEASVKNSEIKTSQFFIRFLTCGVVDLRSGDVVPPLLHNFALCIIDLSSKQQNLTLPL